MDKEMKDVIMQIKVLGFKYIQEMLLLKVFTMMVIKLILLLSLL